MPKRYLFTKKTKTLVAENSDIIKQIMLSKTVLNRAKTEVKESSYGIILH